MDRHDEQQQQGRDRLQDRERAADQAARAQAEQDVIAARQDAEARQRRDEQSRRVAREAADAARAGATCDLVDESELRYERPSGHDTLQQVQQDADGRRVHERMTTAAQAGGMDDVLKAHNQSLSPPPARDDSADAYFYNKHGRHPYTDAHPRQGSAYEGDSEPAPSASKPERDLPARDQKEVQRMTPEPFQNAPDAGAAFNESSGHQQQAEAAKRSMQDQATQQREQAGAAVHKSEQDAAAARAREQEQQARQHTDRQRAQQNQQDQQRQREDAAQRERSEREQAQRKQQEQRAADQQKRDEEVKTRERLQQMETQRAQQNAAPQPSPPPGAAEVQREHQKKLEADIARYRQSLGGAQERMRTNWDRAR
ncbi:MAG: hypothetical protein ACIAS6_02415 [Phycisphaerales bacterium JB060]